VYKKYLLKINIFFTRKFTNVVMRDGRKILARQLVEKVVFLHTGNLIPFDVHYLCIIKLSITKYHIH
jgi:hypothetical protein